MADEPPSRWLAVAPALGALGKLLRAVAVDRDGGGRGVPRGRRDAAQRGLTSAGDTPCADRTGGVVCPQRPRGRSSADSVRFVRFGETTDRLTGGHVSERIEQSYPAGQPHGGPPTAPAKKKRRIFLWVFLAVQLLFIVWIISGLTTANDPVTAADCGSLDLETCRQAGNVGTGIGIALIFGLWLFVDLLLGVIYGIYRLAKRS